MKVKLRLETTWASSVVLPRVQFRVRTMFTPTGRHERRNTMVARIQFWLNAKARAAENAARNRSQPCAFHRPWPHHSVYSPAHGKYCATEITRTNLMLALHLEISVAAKICHDHRKSTQTPANESHKSLSSWGSNGTHRIRNWHEGRRQNVEGIEPDDVSVQQV